MARDHALALDLRPGEGWLRIYRWDRPTVSFGRNEPALGRYDRADAARRGVAFVRRPSGGRAVLHHRELTYAVAVPVGALGGPRTTYALLNAALVGALQGLGVPATLAPPGGAPPGPAAGPCFDRAAEGEVTVAGRKLVGSAQVRLSGVLLQHGSLLLEPAQGLLRDLRRESASVPLRGGSASAAPRSVPPDATSAQPGWPSTRLAPTSLLEAAGRIPPWDALVSVLRCALAERLGGSWTDEPSRALPGEEALLERYASEEWTWRR